LRSTKEGLWSLRGRNLKVNEAQAQTDRPRTGGFGGGGGRGGFGGNRGRY